MLVISMGEAGLWLPKSARAFSICKFIGIPWHPFLQLAPPRDRILENSNIFLKKKTTKFILLVYLSKKKNFIRP